MSDADAAGADEAMRRFCFDLPVDLQDLLDWAVIDCLLSGKQALPDRAGDGIRFPYSPESPALARRQAAAARAARRLLAGFVIPAQEPDEHPRPYHARVADALEGFLATCLPGQRPAADAAAAADSLLRLTTIHHPLPAPGPAAG